MPHGSCLWKHPFWLMDLEVSVHLGKEGMTERSSHHGPGSKERGNAGIEHLSPFFSIQTTGLLGAHIQC